MNKYIAIDYSQCLANCYRIEILYGVITNTFQHDLSWWLCVHIIWLVDILFYKESLNGMLLIFKLNNNLAIHFYLLVTLSS